LTVEAAPIRGDAVLATHPYISGPGNVEQMIGFLRKNFPAVVNSETVKKFALAPNNESYVINALQFIGMIDADGKRTDKGQAVSVLGQDKFSDAFGDLIRESYYDLFELRGEDAWTLSKSDLTSYFRTADKTSEAIGLRQAGLFHVFARLAGHEPPTGASPTVSKAKSQKAKPTGAKAPKVVVAPPAADKPKPPVVDGGGGRRDVAMTVRIEINLPANGSQETYDNIFKSIRAHLIDE
jgi:hypothetical protein